jgi:hypothetical protein
MKETPELNYASLLAEFAGLKSDEALLWRDKNPSFVPYKWWDYQPICRSPFTGEEEPFGRKLWQLNQQWLREAWEKHFEIEQYDLMRLLLSVFDPENLDPFRDPQSFAPLYATLADMPEEWYLYQQGLLYLHAHPKLAKFCQRCKGPIVGVGKFCSRISDRGESCYTLHRQEYKQKFNAEYYEGHADKLRKARRAKYARSKGKRPSCSAAFCM